VAAICIESLHLETYYVVRAVSGGSRSKIQDFTSMVENDEMSDRE
jgi:hypothetical protein